MKRFFDKVDKTENCWNWKAATRSGYGVLKINRKLISAHRLSWEIHYGKIPENILVCHHCDNKKCVNPKHLFLGTYSDNAKDAFNKGRMTMPIGRNFKKMHYPKNASISLEKAMIIKGIVINRGEKKLIDIAKQLDVPYEYIRNISCGKILKNR